MNFVRYSAARKLFRIGYLTALAIMIILSLLSYFGSKTGNFVMTVDDEAFQRGISICDSNDEESVWKRWLSADPVEKVLDLSIKFLDIPAICECEGNYEDTEGKFVAYSFYLKNIGEVVTDVYYRVNILKETKSISKAIRVMMVIDGKVVTDEYDNKSLTYESKTVYQAPDEEEYVDYCEELAGAKNFVDDNTILIETVKDLRPNQVKKITFIMWLEGDDPDCVGESTATKTGLYGSAIRLEMEFDIDPFEN